MTNKIDITSYKKGLRAENHACWWLRLQGFRILGQRIKTPLGELDILAKRGKLLCVVEVKYRRTIDEAAYAITHKQKNRVRDAAELYLAARPDITKAVEEIRFDAILMAARHFPRHIKNAW